MSGGTHRTQGLGFGIRHLKAVQKWMFEWLHNLEMFAVPPKIWHLDYVTVPSFWQNIEALRMLCLSSPLVFAFCASGFGANAMRFEHLLLGTAMTEFTIMFFVCFIEVMGYSVANFFMSASFFAIAESICLCASEGVLLPVPSK